MTVTEWSPSEASGLIARRTSGRCLLHGPYGGTGREALQAVKTALSDLLVGLQHARRVQRGRVSLRL